MENEVGGACSTHGRGEKVYSVLLGKLEVKRPLGRPRLRWKDGIRMDLREIFLWAWSGFNWLRIWPGGWLL
jgi:hypothetical protein